MRALLWTPEVRRSLLWLLVVLPVFALVTLTGAKPNPCPQPGVVVGPSCVVLLR